MIFRNAFQKVNLGKAQTQCRYASLFRAIGPILPMLLPAVAPAFSSPRRIDDRPEMDAAGGGLLVPDALQRPKRLRVMENNAQTS